MGISPNALYDAVYCDVGRWALDSFESVPYPGCPYKQYASTYLLHSIIRKWIPSDTKEADAAAHLAFTSANNRCKDWSLSLDWEIDVVLFGEIRRILDDFLHPGGNTLIQSYYDLIGHGRPGPGASVGSHGTSYYTKYFASRLAATSQYLYDEYRHYCEWIPFLSDAEANRYEMFGGPSIVNGSRCSFVPKTSSTSRMICVEPSLNMFYQLGLAHHLELRLKQFFGIDLKTQPSVNHRLAYEGSKNGVFSTIDLSSASDSISLRLCESLFPKWFFELLVNLRSRTTEISGQTVPLFMVSTMGNGFTFPLQTIIFSAILQACTNVYYTSSSPGHYGREDIKPWSCFGDDLICSKEIFGLVTRCLGFLGFSINPAKTFSEGPFRESCGSDWLYGQPVRPVFVRKLDLPYDYFVTINQLNEWSAYTGIPLRNTVRLLRSQLASKFHTYVPFDSNNDSGIRVPSTLIKKRFDSNLSFLYHSWERRASKLYIYEGRIHSPSGMRKFVFNPSGLYCAFLFGEVVSLTISIRHDRKLFKRKLRCSPNWDYIPTDRMTNGVKLSWRQWETAVGTNLM